MTPEEEEGRKETLKFLFDALAENRAQFSTVLYLQAKILAILSGLKEEEIEVKILEVYRRSIKHSEFLYTVIQDSEGKLKDLLRNLDIEFSGDDSKS